MRKIPFVILAFMLFSGHDMFLKLDNYFLEPNKPATIMLYNGTFENSDNIIDRNRMVDVSLIGNGKRSQVDTTQWREEDKVTILDFNTGQEGTWVAGVSTRPRNIELAATDFNKYLEHDGVLDMLEWRKKNNALEQDAVEKYSKHVKTIFQVGNKRTDDWQTVLGYPLEFVPFRNPYGLHTGEKLLVELRWQGEPLANQLVYVGSDGEGHTHSHDHAHDHEHSHSGGDAGHDHSHDHHENSGADHHHHATQLRTNDHGQLRVNITNEGVWYLRTIHLTHSEEAGLTHESNWATLTFEVGHGHPHADGTHTHDDGHHHHHHDEEAHSHGIPTYVYWIASFAIIAGLFFWFNRNN